MIVFSSSITNPEAYRRYARPGIAAAAEPGSEIDAYAAVGSACRSGNLLLEAAARRDDLEALVLVDEYVEIEDPDFCARVREALRDPAVAVAGWMGASGVRGIAWWEGRVSCGPVVRRHGEHGGGSLSPFAWRRVDDPPAEVDMVDGRLMALSPWAVRNLRFDETLSLGHGYDLDYCLRVRQAGRKVVTARMAAVHHHALELVTNKDLWIEGHIRFAELWDGRMPGTEPTTDWKARARRAEAERDAARTVAYSSTSRVDARVVPLQRELDAMIGSRAWRLTAPLRALNRLRRRRAQR
jgi:hypothetical protein